MCISLSVCLSLCPGPRDRYVNPFELKLRLYMFSTMGIQLSKEKFKNSNCTIDFLTIYWFLQYLRMHFTRVRALITTLYSTYRAVTFRDGGSRCLDDTKSISAQNINYWSSYRFFRVSNNALGSKFLILCFCLFKNRKISLNRIESLLL